MVLVNKAREKVGLMGNKERGLTGNGCAASPITINRCEGWTQVDNREFTDLTLTAGSANSASLRILNTYRIGKQEVSKRFEYTISRDFIRVKKTRQ